MIQDTFSEKKENKLHSYDSEIYEYGSENLDSMYRNLYVDCLYKEHLSKKSLKKEKSDVEEDLSKLTLVILPTATFLNNYENESLYHVLNYWSYLGVSNIIISDTANTLEAVKEFESKFKNFKTIEVDENKSKSKNINEIIRNIQTEYLLISDNNALISEKNFYQSYSLLNYYDFIYPSDRSFLKINSLNDFEQSFDFKEMECDRKEYLNYDYNMLFCRLDCLKKVGGYNPHINSEKIMSNEINVRLNLSNFSIMRRTDSAYLFGFVDEEIDENSEKELIKQVNLSRYDDFNILVNQDEEMFYLANANISESYEFSDNYMISVIIPIYNCEDFYLDRSITSLKNQTLGFENIEVIIVDDCSKYLQSRERIKRYSDKYDNIKSIFLDVNVGSGSARNVGIKHASADIICFLDYDDYYVNSYCENVYDSMKDSKNDIFIANYINLSRNTTQMNNWNYLDLVEGKKYLENYKEDFNVIKIDPSIWAKGYRKEFLTSKNIAFSNHKVAQDNLFNVKTLFQAEGILINNVPSVVYDTRDNDDEELKSRTLIINKNSLITRIRVYEEIFELFEQYAPDESENKLNSSLNYWTKKHLFNSDLDKNDFIDVAKEAKNLIDIRLEKKSIKIPKQYVNIFESISQGNFDESYEIYLNDKY